MTYQEMFAQVKELTKTADIGKVKGNVAIEVNITGDGAGIFYIEVKDGVLSVEPYNYINHDARFTLSAKDFIKIISGRLDPITAFTLGRAKVEGNLQKALLLKDIRFN